MLVAVVVVEVEGPLLAYPLSPLEDVEVDEEVEEVGLVEDCKEVDVEDDVAGDVGDVVEDDVGDGEEIEGLELETIEEVVVGESVTGGLPPTKLGEIGG